MTDVRAWAPGRVNLIGEHVDHRGGVVLPMAIQLGTEVAGRITPGRIELTSDAAPGVVAWDLPVPDPRRVRPAWGRLVAGVATAAGTDRGIAGKVRTDLPLGAGLSSSAALGVAVALALGVEGGPVDVAIAARRGEELATGVPCGIMDQLVSTTGVAGHAVLIDCTTLATEPVRLPDDAEVQVVDSGERRQLEGTAYARRREECDAAEAVVGPLREAGPDDLASLRDPILRRRARHVVTELERVGAVVEALRGDDVAAVGAAIDESHRSLRDDFEVSTPTVDRLVDELRRTPGVLGARLVGGGFGGSVLAWCRPGTSLAGGLVVRASEGARLAGAATEVRRPAADASPARTPRR